jgi:hypothetical protein
MLESQEYRELREQIGALDTKLEGILISLKTCQSRCHVDNPPRTLSRWRGLGQALLALIK